MSALREALKPVAKRFGSPVREHEVLRICARLRSGENVLEEARNQALRWAQKRSGGSLPAEAWEANSFEYFAGGRNSMAVRIMKDGLDLWALRAEDPDKNVPGRIWTTEIVIGTDGDGAARFGARLLANSNEEYLQVEPHSPGFVQQVAEHCGLFVGNYEVSAEPVIIEDEAEVDIFVDMLTDTKRTFPVVAISTANLDGATLLDAEILSRALLGLACIYIVRPEASWALSRRIGKMRSVYNGAVRIYLPGFREDASPYAHRLILAQDLLTSDATKRVSAEIRSLVARESVLRSRLGKEVLSFTAVRQASISLSRSELKSSNAPDSDLLIAAQDLIDVQAAQIAELERNLQFFSEEHEAAEERATIAEQVQVSANFRIQQLVEQLKAKGVTVDGDLVLPTRWTEFAEWCDVNLVGRLVLSPRARRQVREPVYEDVRLAAQSLLWLADECRDRRIKGGGTLGELQILDAIRNAHCGSDAFDFDWQGRKHLVDWHIKSGGNSHDPKRCLRIYYFWDEGTQQIVIAEMPSHRRTAAS